MTSCTCVSIRVSPAQQTGQVRSVQGQGTKRTIGRFGFFPGGRGAADWSCAVAILPSSAVRDDMDGSVSGCMILASIVGSVEANQFYCCPIALRERMSCSVCFVFPRPCEEARGKLNQTQQKKNRKPPVLMAENKPKQCIRSIITTAFFLCV